MDYYEELGIDSTASEEEIRKAHRRLVKLVHPDQQTDETLKQLGETQMRRLNLIVETLCDPERRQEYDEQLKEGVHAFDPAALGRRPVGGRWRPLRWWIASTLGAVVLTVGAVWFWADNWGSSFSSRAPTYISSGATDTGAPDPKTAPIPNPASRPDSDPPVPKTSPSELNSRTVAQVPGPAAANAKSPSMTSKSPAAAAQLPRKSLNLASTNVVARPRAVAVNLPPPPNVSAAPVHSETATLPLVALPPVDTRAPQPPPAPAKTATAINPVKASRMDPLEGEWVYAPMQPEKSKPGFYPPEFIDLRLFWNQGGLHGLYHAKYSVTDRPISPDVNFTLTPDGSARKFLWEASNGSKGTFKISGVEGETIRVEWRTTVHSRKPGLTAGTATLVRKAQ